MFRYAFITLCSLATLVGSARADEPAKPVSLGVLRGEWRVVSHFMKNGSNFSVPGVGILTIDDKGLTTQEGHIGTLKITRVEPGKPFGQIDFVGDAGKYTGIYKLSAQQDELYLSFTLGDKRPTDLDFHDENISLGLLTPQKQAKVVATRTFFEKLKGTWDITSATSDGHPLSQDEVKSRHVEFSGYPSLNFVNDDKKMFFSIAMEADVSQKPIPMDFISDHTDHALFQYNGDTIEIAIGGEDRPKDFKPAAKVKTYKLTRRP